MYNALTKPLNLKTLSLKNRIVMAPMSRYHSPQGAPSDEMVRYYQRRAEADVGLVITESVFIDPSAGYNVPNAPIFYSQLALIQWRKVVNAVHRAQGKIFLQILHAGGMRQIGDPYQTDAPSFAPSAVPHPFIKNAQPPTAMQTHHIDAIIESYVRAAKTAQTIGFDGVEIHGAHGYLIDQFFWDVTNKRTDEYGGNELYLRTRFAYEVIKALRQAVGVTYPISFRFSNWKLGDYDAKLFNSPQQLAQFIEPLSEAGVDIFHVSTRYFDQPGFDNSSYSLAAWTKKLSGKIVIAVGSVGYDNDFISSIFSEKKASIYSHKMDLVETQIANGQYDLIAIGRPLLADPLWWQKILRNNVKDIQEFKKELLATVY